MHSNSPLPSSQLVLPRYLRQGQATAIPVDSDQGMDTDETGAASKAVEYWQGVCRPRTKLQAVCEPTYCFTPRAAEDYAFTANHLTRCMYVLWTQSFGHAFTANAIDDGDLCSICFERPANTQLKSWYVCVCARCAMRCRMKEGNGYLYGF